MPVALLAARPRLLPPVTLPPVTLAPGEPLPLPGPDSCASSISARPWVTRSPAQTNPGDGGPRGPVSPAAAAESSLRCGDDDADATADENDDDDDSDAAAVTLAMLLLRGRLGDTGGVGGNALLLLVGAVNE
jgi:hypothetical protein